MKRRSDQAGERRAFARREFSAVRDDDIVRYGGISRGCSHLTPFSLGCRFFWARKRNGNNTPRHRRGKDRRTCGKCPFAYIKEIVAKPPLSGGKKVSPEWRQNHAALAAVSPRPCKGRRFVAHSRDEKSRISVYYTPRRHKIQYYAIRYK